MLKVTAHVQEYIGRYVMFASIILVPLAGGLGSLASEWGGNDTRLGQAVTAAASAVGAAAAIGVWLRNLGAWQIAEQESVVKMEVADAEIRAAGSNVTPDAP